MTFARSTTHNWVGRPFSYDASILIIIYAQLGSDSVDKKQRPLQQQHLLLRIARCAFSNDLFCLVVPCLLAGWCVCWQLLVPCEPSADCGWKLLLVVNQCPSVLFTHSCHLRVSAIWYPLMCTWWTLLKITQKNYNFKIANENRERQFKKKIDFLLWFYTCLDYITLLYVTECYKNSVLRFNPYFCSSNAIYF